MAETHPSAVAPARVSSPKRLFWLAGAAFVLALLATIGASADESWGVGAAAFLALAGALVLAGFCVALVRAIERRLIDIETALKGAQPP